MKKSIVLSDELLEEYYDFKHNKGGDSSDIEALLSSYKPHLTNVAQLERIGITKKSILNSLISSGRTHQTGTLLELSDKTKYKVILDKEKTDYPYVKIGNDILENNYTATFYKEKERIKAQKHIKALLKNAVHVFIYDKYITKRWDYSKKFFTDLLPRKPLNIWYLKNRYEDDLSNKAIEIKAIYKPWKIAEGLENNKYEDSHDRYILIDRKIEIILTSGFDNLFDISSDFTYIVRDVEKK